MEMASKKVYLKRRAKSPVQQNIKEEQGKMIIQEAEDFEVDTNVFSISFNVLKDGMKNLHQGDAIMCKQCACVINIHSKVLNSQQYLALINNYQLEKKEKIQEESKDPMKESSNFILLQNDKNMVLELKENESVWICEFCNHQNQILIEPEEMPKLDDVTYILQSAQQVQLQKQQLEHEQSFIFCIDNSGSMSTSTEVKGNINLKHGISKEEYEMLKQFIEPGDEMQFYPGQKKNVTYISRKQCVLAAIENQINELRKTHPNRIVGLVTFNSEVVIFGDGQGEPTVIAGDRLNKAEDIREIIQKLSLGRAIKDSAEDLMARFSSLQEKGQTALGPALMASILLAQKGKPGSMVILCTDGLANKGLGALEGENFEGFYNELAVLAQKSGIAISIVTIKGEGCRMDVLGQLAEKTNGNVTRVNPSEIDKDFAEILQDEVVGTAVKLEVQLHRALKFRNEDNGVNDKIKKDVGNATVRTNLTFEYKLKNDQELQEYQINIAELVQVPFQAKIFYTSLNGDKLLRVITKTVKTTENLQEAEKEARVDLIHCRIQQQTANLVRRGSFTKAQKFNVQYNQYAVQNDMMNMNEANQIQNEQFVSVNAKLQKVAAKKEQRVMKKKIGSVNKPQTEMKSSVSKNEKKEEGQGFFAKLFGSSAKSQKKQRQASIEKEENLSNVSVSDEDLEEAEIMQFQLAKKK